MLDKQKSACYHSKVASVKGRFDLAPKNKSKKALDNIGGVRYNAISSPGETERRVPCKLNNVCNLKHQKRTRGPFCTQV